MDERPILGLTMGDPAGIGPEICLRALREPSVLENCIPVLFGDAGVLKRVAQPHGRGTRGGSEMPKAASTPIPPAECPVVPLSEWKTRKSVTTPLVVDCGAIEASSLRPGEVAAACGKAAYIYIEQAIQAALNKQIGG